MRTFTKGGVRACWTTCLEIPRLFQLLFCSSSYELILEHKCGLEVEWEQIPWYYCPSQLGKQGEFPMEKVGKTGLLCENQRTFYFQIWRNSSGREALGTKLFVNKANTFPFFPSRNFTDVVKSHYVGLLSEQEDQLKCKPPACTKRILTSDSDLQKRIHCHSRPYCAMQLLYWNAQIRLYSVYFESHMWSVLPPSFTCLFYQSHPSLTNIYWRRVENFSYLFWGIRSILSFSVAWMSFPSYYKMTNHKELICYS